MNFRFLTFTLFLCSLFIGKLQAQTQLRIGILPSININKKLPKQWELNLKTEFRQFVLQHTAPTPLDWQYQYALTDISLASAKKIGLNSKVVGGYLMRISTNTLIHRTIQQMVWVQKMNTFRIGHRITFDQTFGKGISPRFRGRYRINTEFPLGGQVINSQEFYLKINHEYLHNLQDSKYDLEVRLSPFVGYNLTDKNKIELGIDYRIDRFLLASTRQTIFLCVNWYMKL